MECVDDFIKAYHSVDFWWEALDRPILRACSEQPGHINVREVFAKVALVNRVYRANLQMGGKDAEWKLAERLVDSDFDAVMRPLGDVQEFDRGSFPIILNVHERFVRVAFDVTSRIENSFCAKYLSFNRPRIVPVFDGYAFRRSWRLVKHALPADLFPQNQNRDFGYHCEAILSLRESLIQSGVKSPNLKFIDHVLYSDR